MDGLGGTSFFNRCTNVNCFHHALRLCLEGAGGAPESGGMAMCDLSGSNGRRMRRPSLKDKGGDDDSGVVIDDVHGTDVFREPQLDRLTGDVGEEE